ncbi:isochorismate synthase [Flavobacteriales bacterium 33_180_T64]|nr:isochorismate synthase [Flavobacteriales bacterium 33_180_T64]
MDQEDFFSQIATHYKRQLPFVTYRKPNEKGTTAMLQHDDEIHVVTNFNESGFVFSPFDSNAEALIFPVENCEIVSSEIELNSFTVNRYAEHNRNIDQIESSKTHHLKLVQHGIDSIKADIFKKVVLSRTESVPVLEEDALEIFKSLLKTYASAFCYIWYHPKVGLWLGATPETLVNIEGLRFKTMALAGTQPYIDKLDVAWDSKNIDEQEFVTDFIVKELNPLVERLNTSEVKTIKAGQLLHLQSQISGLLKVKGLKDIIFALHPTPAVCGLPKKKTKNFIIDNENYNREFYTGFLGELNIKTSKTRNTNRRNVENNAYATVKTASQLFVNLRCMQFKNQQALIYVGGGITIDSNPEEEWEETVSKTRTMLSVLY